MKIKIPWESGTLSIQFKQNSLLQTLVPNYPAALSIIDIQQQIEDNLLLISAQIRKARKIVLILEDTNRFSNTAAFYITKIFGGLNRVY